jgi:hypothetical protein
MGWMIRLFLGVVMLALGAGVALTPLFKHRPWTGTIWLDMTFAVVFMLRGVMNVRSALRRRGGMNR